MSETLVERLRGWGEKEEYPDLSDAWNLMCAAAERIEELEERFSVAEGNIEHWKTSAELSQARYEDLQAEVQRLYKLLNDRGISHDELYE